MKHPVLKLIGGIALLTILFVAFTVSMFYYVEASVGSENEKFGALKLESLTQSIDLVTQNLENNIEDLDNRALISARLEALALRERGDEEGVRVTGDDSMVVRVQNGRVAYPDGGIARLADYEPSLFSDSATVKAGTIRFNASGEETAADLFACPISGDYYYVSWILYDQDFWDDVYRQSDGQGLLTAAQTLYGGKLIEIVEMDGSLNFILCPEEFDGFETPESMGITPDVIEAAPKSLTIDGVKYASFFYSMPETGETNIFLVDSQTGSPRVLELVSIVSGVVLMILIALLTWLISIQHMIRGYILTPSLKKYYAPSRVRKLALAVFLMGAILVFATGAMSHTLAAISGYAKTGEEMLTILAGRLDENQREAESNAAYLTESYVTFAESAARLIGENPALARREKLTEMSDIIGANYIMLFDENGNETACSQRYVGFSLGAGGDAASADFRRLLKGVPSIAHEPQTESVTNQRLQIVGARLELPGSDGFGALLLAMDPVQSSSMSVNETLKSMTPPERLCLVIDPASGAVTGSSAEELTGTRAESLGFDDACLQGKYMDYFKILDAQYYGVSIERDGLVYYSLRNVEGDLARAVRCGGIACAGYAAAYLILAAYLLTGYTQKRFDYYATIGRSVSTSVVETMTPDGKLKHTIDPSRRWAFDFATWRSMLPEQKTKAVLLALIALEMMNVIPTFFRGGSNNDILNFILMGQWKRGVSLFSLTAILLLIMATALGVLLMRFALKLLSSVLGTKGETVCRLTYSLIQYAALLAVLFYGFDYFGLDVRALLAPLALVSLALSLGSKDLVQDVLAGITIVFEGEYQVGDMVDIGGYRGKVVEIGVRSTKLLGRGDNIKIIYNRDVRNVLNLTKMNSWMDMEFTLPDQGSLIDLEALMQQELPAIGQAIPEIISGPIYKGIVAMGRGNITIAITCECNEEDAYRIQRKLYAMLHDQFKAAGLTLA